MIANCVFLADTTVALVLSPSAASRGHKMGTKQRSRHRRCGDGL
jgi:hypothetical protein